MILVHHHGNVGIGLGRGQDQVTKENFAGVAAGTAGRLEDHGAVGLVSRFHDGLDLLEIVHVERRDAIAVFGGMVEQKPKRNERHRKNLIRNLDGKTPPGDDFTYLCSNCHQARPNNDRAW